MRRKPAAVDVIAGAEGVTRGLLDADFDVVGAIALDDLAAKTYRANFP